MYLPADNIAYSKTKMRKDQHWSVDAKANKIEGIISEVVYSEERPLITQMLLLPLLQQLGQQSRWQLWFTPYHKLSREWLLSVGLPLSKIMQFPIMSVTSMAKALRTGNYSVVIGWLPSALTDHEFDLLSQAAEEGCAIGFIMRPDRSKIPGDRPRSGLKIHFSLYH